ncbi:MAG: hypothetical protein KAT77_06260 [Nanoarchaeota archaeon]|nr:hypothetical protein [Nanoarchaeota archaeon]
MNKKWLILFCLLFLAACSVENQLDIPYHRQEGPSCVQSQMVMAIKYFYPDSTITQAELDQKTGRGPNQWTWFSQAMPVLIEEGLDAYYYSLSPYEELDEISVMEIYGPEDGELIKSVTNWEALENSIEYLRNNPERFEARKLEWSEVEDAFSKGYVMLMIIDYNVLMGHPEKPYAGHGVTITKIDSKNVVFHNSALGPNQAALKEDFIEAWDAPGTDNDAIVIKGKLT